MVRFSYLTAALLSLAAATSAPAAAGSLGRAAIDYAEEMRSFVEDIAAFARGRDPDFIVVAAHAPELVLEAPLELVDGPPDRAQAFLQAIDGLLVHGARSATAGSEGHHAATADDREAKWSALATAVTGAGDKVLVMDVVGEAEARTRLERRGEHGFISFAADAAGPDLTALPPSAHRPPNENGRSVTTLAEAENFAYVGGRVAYGSASAMVAALTETNHDILIVDVFNGRRPLKKDAVRSLQYKKLGARRLVLAHLDIGTAARDRYYWQREWKQGAPGWIDAPVAGRPGRHYVRYWDPDWQRLIAGDSRSYIHGIMALGFDGVVLEGLDTWRYFALGDTLQPLGSLAALQ